MASTWGGVGKLWHYSAFLEWWGSFFLFWSKISLQKEKLKEGGKSQSSLHWWLTTSPKEITDEGLSPQGKCWPWPDCPEWRALLPQSGYPRCCSWILFEGIASQSCHPAQTPTWTWVHVQSTYKIKPVAGYVETHPGSCSKSPQNPLPSDKTEGGPSSFSSARSTTLKSKVDR